MNELKIKPELHNIHGYSILLLPLSSNIIHIECAINNGFINETKKTSGINHLLEHVLSESWKKCKNNCYKFWNNIGVDMNASTDLTVLKYYTSGLIEDTDIMLDYMIDIMNQPIFSPSKIKKEKKAVINELLVDVNDPHNNLINFFNQNFYVLEGLQYSTDVNLQINNLKHIQLKDLNDIFLKYYNKNNIVFMISGKFNKHDILQKFKDKLNNYSVSTSSPNYCFSLKNDILFLKDTTSSIANIIIGFPCNVMYNHPYYMLIPSVLLMLKNILFDYLRSVKDLIYGININYEQTICGIVVTIEVNVLPKNISIVLHSIFLILHQFKTEFVKPKQIQSIKKQYKYMYYTTDLSPSNISDIYIEQYINQIYIQKPKFYSIYDIIQKVESLNKDHIKDIINMIFNFKQCLCVYQSKTNLNLKLSDYIKK